MLFPDIRVENGEIYCYIPSEEIDALEDVALEEMVWLGWDPEKVHIAEAI